RTIAQARALGAAVFAACGVRVGICADVYQLALSDPDGLAAIALAVDGVFNVQLADVPGRHEPGTGTLPFDDILSRLDAAGYARVVALESRPTEPVRAPGFEAGPAWSKQTRER